MSVKEPNLDYWWGKVSLRCGNQITVVTEYLVLIMHLVPMMIIWLHAVIVKNSFQG